MGLLKRALFSVAMAGFIPVPATAGVNVICSSHAPPSCGGGSSVVCTVPGTSQCDGDQVGWFCGSKTAGGNSCGSQLPGAVADASGGAGAGAHPRVAGNQLQGEAGQDPAPQQKPSTGGIGPDYEAGTASGGSGGSGRRSGGSGDANIDDECRNSVRISGRYSCDGTRYLINGAKLANVAGMAMSTVALQQNAAANQRTASLQGTMSAQTQAAAGTLTQAGQLEVSMGALNFALGATQLAMAMKHRQNAQQIRSGNVPGAYTEDAQAAVKTYGSKAVREQGKIQNDATNGALFSALIGTAQMIQGNLNRNQARALTAAAAQMGSVGHGAPVFAPQAPQLAAGPGDALSPVQPTVITGSGSSGTAQQIAAATPSPGPAGDLGTPFMTGNAQNPGLPTGGPLERAQDNPNADPGKGGAGGAVGGLTTQAATDPSAGQGTQQALNHGNPGYDAGAGGGKAGGALGAGGAENTADLNGALSQFLPKKEEEGHRGSGILEYGDRSPATVSAPDSFLGRDTNIFQLIHDTYQTHQKTQRVGI